MDKQPIVFAGSSHPRLSAEVAEHLGLDLGKVRLETFPDKEIFVQLLETVRGREVFLIQSIARDPNLYLMELLTLVDACKRASAKSIVAVIPYFGYARQDRKDQGRVPITAKLVADLLQTAGVTRVVTMDLHAAQIQGFFNVPVDNLSGRTALVRQLEGTECVVACPDIGSVKIARGYADALGMELAVVDKQRLSPDKVEVTTLIGDIESKTVLLVDDLCSTAGTLVAAAEACKERGAKSVLAAITHGLMVGSALEKIEKSPIEQILITDTVPGANELRKETKKIEVVPVGNLFGEAIARILSAQSLTPLFG